MNTKEKRVILSIGIACALTLNSIIVWSSNPIKDIIVQYNSNLKISLNGDEQKLKNEDGSPMSPISYEDRTYLPVRALSNLLGTNINYDSTTSTVELSTENKDISNFQGVKMPNVLGKMNSPNYWINKAPNANNIILDTNGISAFNNKITTNKYTKVYDLTSYPETLSKEQLTTYVSELHFPVEDRFNEDKKVGNDYYNAIRKNINLSGISDDNPLSYGFTVLRTDVRTLPTKDPSYKEANDIAFDYFQETALEAVEPVLILYKTLDGTYYFIQSRNYRGWVSSSDIAVTITKEQWLSYQDENDFIVVTANKIHLPPNPYSSATSGLDLGMGCKLPIYTGELQPKVVDGMSSAGSYVAKFPIRDETGLLLTKDVLISSSKDISVGFMPYTIANVIRQAFKMTGDRYGWGGLFASRDCSSFICDIYKSFGIILPRNTTEQEVSAGTTLKFTNDNYEQRSSSLSSLNPGSILYMANHEVLYLGADGGRQYVIQSVHAYGDKSKPKSTGGFEKIFVNAIVVSDLDLAQKRTGKTFLESLTSAKTIE